MSGAWQSIAELWPYAYALVEALGFALIPLVLIRRREPASTVAWILVLLFVPVFGAVLFLLHGRDRLRWPARRKRAADSVVVARLRAARGRPSWVDLDSELDGLELAERRIFRVAAGLGSATEVSAGNLVALLPDGRSAQLAIEAAIDCAERSVLVQYYLIKNDETGRRFRDKLLAAARRGVQVRLLMDAYGGFWLPRSFFRELRRAGGRAVEFLPLAQALWLPMNLRNHRKLVVVDGRIGFTGGINVGDEYSAIRGREPMWRDSAVQIEGPAVGALSSVFLRDWHFMTRDLQADESFFASDARSGSATVAIVPSGPDSRIEAIHRAFFAAIVGAHQRVWITTPYFVPDRSLLVALETAALRGVDVKIILPGISNHKVTQRAARSYYSELLEFGVEIFEYQPGMIHAKTMLVDEKTALVGSANMDMRSFRLNFELHAIIHDAEFAAALEQSFGDDLGRCRAVEREAWHKRPFYQRVGEGAARLVSPIL